MPSRRKAVNMAIADFLTELGGADSELLLDGVAAGCAIIAYADGRVTPEEQKRFLGLIRRFEPLRVFGRGDLVESFERATAAFSEDHDEGERLALQLVGRLRDRRRLALTLMKTCKAIALADGDFDIEERRAMIRICGSLGIDPADHGLGVDLRSG